MGLSVALLDSDIEDKLGFDGLDRQMFFLTVWTDKNLPLSVHTVKKLIVAME